jgi:uncharacterized membrane protein YdjX (TVP38/TMEM64 family)
MVNTNSSRNFYYLTKSPGLLVISLTLIILFVLLYFLIPEINDFVKEAYRVLTSEDEERISAWVDTLGVWGPIFIPSAMVVQMFLFIVPSPLLMVISVLAYGPYFGSGLAVLSVLLAAAVGYWLGRLLGEAAVYRLVGERAEKKIEYYSERYGLWAVVITRLSPILSNDTISFVGGLIKIPFWKFLIATFAGITPLAAIIAYIGESNERLITGSIIVTAASITALVVYIVLDRINQKRKS